METEVLILVAALSFLAGALTWHVVRELTPYVILWYKLRTTPVLEPEPPTHPESLKDLRAYNKLTLRKRFVMERDKGLN